MKKFLLVATALLSLSFSLSAQMTDTQVVNYVKTAKASGKSETQIGRELLSRGVTKEQAERLKEKYAAQYSGTESEFGGLSDTQSAAGEGTAVLTGGRGTAATAKSRSSASSVQPSGRTAGIAVRSGASGMEEAVQWGDGAGRGQAGTRVFGHDIFSGRNLTFEPNENAATPEDYRLGPGDEVVIEIWGDNEASISRVISPEGKIYISQIGPVQLSGLTIQAASEKIRKMLASKYAGVEGANPSSSVSVTLGTIRTIQVNVMGEVELPGTYRLSSFSSVFTALYRAGGVNEIGSMREIKVVRAGKEVAKVDIYGYLFDGKSDTDIKLQEDDIIIVPPYGELVTVEGSVKRPMHYEMKEGENLETLIEYAGGFASNAYRDDVRVIRFNGNERELSTVKSADYGSFALADGDVVVVGESLDRFSNMVEVRGYVFRPGMFELGGNIATVRQLIANAGGLREDAFLARAVLFREKDNLDVETIPLNLGGILDGSAEDMLLKKNDVVVVSGKNEIEDRGTLTINGMVFSPGTFPFTDNTTVEDLILRAGGLVEGASTARVDIARRVVDPASTESMDVIGEVYTFPLVDGFAVDGGDKFLLEPYDIVSVRSSPGYRTQSFVYVEGEVNFPGNYVLLDRNEKLSDVLKRTGGFTGRAYPKGAYLLRNSSDGQLARNISKLADRNSTAADSLDVNRLDVNGTFTVALDLDKAMKKPGSNYDITLRSGDRIVIPEFNSTVRVLGEVMSPNAVVYNPNKTLRYYINAAGGYSANARRSKVYVVYANGSASKARLNNVDIEPGCTIIVPAKGERKGVSSGDLVAMSSAATSLATLVSVLFRVL